MVAYRLRPRHVTSRRPRSNAAASAALPRRRRPAPSPSAAPATRARTSRPGRRPTPKPLRPAKRASPISRPEKAGANTNPTNRTSPKSPITPRSVTNARSGRNQTRPLADPGPNPGRPTCRRSPSRRRRGRARDPTAGPADPLIDPRTSRIRARTKAAPDWIWVCSLMCPLCLLRTKTKWVGSKKWDGFKFFLTGFVLILTRQAPMLFLVHVNGICQGIYQFHFHF